MGRMTGLLGAADEKLVMLRPATSGDTGSAVAHGFHNVPGVEVVVLYPEGKISRLQECQMTALGGNIHPLRVAGTFDDCQRLVKELFADAPFRKRRRVTSADSINLLRWIPQAFYYFLRLLPVAAGHGRRPSRRRRAERQLRKPRRRNAGPAHGTAPRAAIDCRPRTSTMSCPSSSARASTARGRRCGLRPMRWMSAHRAISNGCCRAALRRRSGDAARRTGGIPLRRCLDPPHDRRAV